MAIAEMLKVMIVSHQAEAAELLESLQYAGICQILNADEAIVSKNWPELGAAGEQPRTIKELLNQLTERIAFLKNYTKDSKGLAGMLSPRTVIDEQAYQATVCDQEVLTLVDQCHECEAAIEKLRIESENLCGILERLEPWASLESPVEELGKLETAVCLTGLVPIHQFDKAAEQMGELSAVVEVTGTTGGCHACLVVCLKEHLTVMQRLLRSADFEPVVFEGPHLGPDGTIGTHKPMTGTVAELIKQYTNKLNETIEQLHFEQGKAALLSENLLKLEILHDHYANLLNREQTRSDAPATEATAIFEGWVKKRDYSRLEKIVSGFGASSLSKIEPVEDEEIPVEIENSNYVRPFEAITRLYGMPKHVNIDPTIFLAPFFALFFALCLTDAGYALVVIAIIAWLLKKIQGDNKMMWMFGICSVVTIVAGALTGGWFGDAIQQFIPALMPLRARIMWFDPLEEPMVFFKLSIALGYFQIIFGIFIALVHNITRKDYIAAIFDQLTWLVMLNSIVLFGLAKAGVVPPKLSSVFGMVAILPAATILLFSERQGGLGQRLGMGAYNLFSAVFYLGDILSYARLMALGMVTAGFAMAINVIVKMLKDIPVPVLGTVLAIIVFAGFHLFNVAMSVLSAFVHTLRLQFVEFFPKFFVGGGKIFEPLSKCYKNIYITKQSLK